MHRLVSIALLAAVLSACQTRLEPAPSGDSAWLTEPTYFAAADSLPLDWRYAAKVGLIVNEKSEQASLTWQTIQTENGSDTGGQENLIRLFGPLGAGAVKLEFGPAGARLTDNKGQEYQGYDAESLLARTVRWPLPVDALRFWLFAQPAPGAVFRYQLDEAGQLSALDQLGWQLEFKDWRNYQGRELPRKVFASKTFDGDQGDAPRGEVEVKLITKSWRWQ